jgi:AcrR family transcriptional regulator
MRIPYYEDTGHPIAIASRGRARPTTASPFARTLRDPRTRAIFDAALEVWGQLGYMGASMRHIAAESDQSMGSIYHRFSSKETLYAYVALDCAQHYSRAVLAVVPDDRELLVEPRTVVEALVHRHLEWAESQPTAARFLACLPEHNFAPNVKLTGAIVRERLADAIARWAAWEIEDGRLRDIPCDLIYPLVLGPVQVYAIEWLDDRTSAPPAVAAAALAARAWASLGSPGPRRAPVAAPR